MDLTSTAYGTWSGGRFMHFGEPLSEERFESLVHHAYEKGIRTFMTADVYGCGAADEMLGRALSPFPRESYCLVGTVGHDFYQGKRDGSKGFPRFTHPDLRTPQHYREYVKMATEKSLERCRTDRFDLVMLHNPDSTGYTQDAVWSAMEKLKDEGLTSMLGVAPGPANGFTLDIILNFERFGPLLDWAMIILNPLEPWPGSLCLDAAEQNGIKIITRVVDYGGLFHDDVKPGHKFGDGDHRVFRPAGWVEAGCKKIDQMRPIAEQHNLTMLQLACIWNLSHGPVKSVIPTLIQEPSVNPYAKPIEQKADELAALPEVKLSEDEKAMIAEIGNNKGCMDLKGGSVEFVGQPVADRWSLTEELIETGKKWGIDPAKDLVCTHKNAA